MSTNITPEEMERLYANNPEYHIKIAQVSAHGMERAAKFIELLREVHRDSGCFIKHSCECNSEGTTRWKFAYIREEFVRMNLDKRTDAAWNMSMANSGGPKAGDGLSIPATGTQPCVCPFSMK